jgi:hypothetical protein
MISKFLRSIVVLGLVAVAAPAWAQPYHYRTRPAYDSDSFFRLRLGTFRPQGGGDYWNEVERDFTGNISDFENPVFGVDYQHGLGNRLGLLFSGDYFQGDNTGSYRNFVDNFGNRIRHDTTLDIASFTVGLTYRFTERGAPIVPYVGVGGGLYSWRLQERGDFIDFSPNPPQVFTSRLTADGVTGGYYGLAGLDVPIGRHTSLFAEGRWTKVEDTLKGDFEGFGKLDLSGRQFAAGLSWRM